MDWMKTGQDVSGMPTDDATAQLLLKRRLAQADALRAAEAPQGQMISGHYVAPSWTQHLANLYSKYQGGQEEQQAIKGFQDYQSAQKKRMADALEQYNKDIADRVEQSEQQAPTITGSTGEMAPNMGMVNAPARTTPVSANDRYNALMRYSAAVGNPELTQRAMLGGIEYANKQADTAAERAYQDKVRAGNQEFERIQQKDRQGFELSQQEKNFAQQWKMQQSSQGFQAGESAKQRDLQRELHSADAKAPPSGYKRNADGSLSYIPGGPADPNTKPLTEAQANARVYSDRMSNSHNIVTAYEGDKLKYDPLAVRAIITAPAGIGDITYGMASKDTQSASQAIRDFINATLRRESGAAISVGEYDNAIKQYFPQPGEDKSVTEQKRRNREIAIKGIQAAGYPGGNVPQNKEIKVNF